MSYGYTFNDEIRPKLLEAAREYEANPQSRTKLNAVIMEIQRPLIEKLDKVRGFKEVLASL